MGSSPPTLEVHERSKRLVLLRVGDALLFLYFSVLIVFILRVDRLSICYDCNNNNDFNDNDDDDCNNNDENDCNNNDDDCNNGDNGCK